MPHVAVSQAAQRTAACQAQKGSGGAASQPSSADILETIDIRRSNGFTYLLKYVNKNIKALEGTLESPKVLATLVSEAYKERARGQNLNLSALQVNRALCMN